MASRINDTVTATVILGQNGYDRRLDILAKGFVQPSTYGAAGVIDPAGVPEGHITNHGTVAGGYGGRTGATMGGSGIDFAAAGTLMNAGTISGGIGGYGTQTALPGGTGVTLQAGGIVTNTGDINGGQGGASDAKTGQGGIGVALQAGTLVNSGAITGGGAALPGAKSGVSSAGGVGVSAAGGATVDNSGNLSGGPGSYMYGTGSAGGTGLQLDKSSLTNAGRVNGGTGGAAFAVYGGTGGVGLAITNGAAAINTAMITGGQGGYCTSGIGGNGGAGVDLQSGTLTNAGTITGGAGGYYANGNRGRGGTGVAVTSGAFTAGGTVSGGIGHVGGVGITISGASVTASGTISGGAGTDLNGEAILFGRVAGTLTVNPGAVFNGVVSADGAAGDALVLAGGTGGTLTGLGRQFTHFGTVVAASGASWMLGGSDAMSARETLLIDGTLTVSGTLSNMGDTALGSGGALAPGSVGAILLAGITLVGGSLTETVGGTLAVGTTLPNTGAGILTIEPGAAVTGTGTITAGAISIAGALLAQGGTLTLYAAATGAGTATIAEAATLFAGAALGIAEVDFSPGGGTLSLGVPGAVSSTLSGFGGGDVVDVQNLLATTLTFAGGTLTLLDGATPVDTLVFAGRYAADDFGIRPDDHGGTDIVYVGGWPAASAGLAWHALEGDNGGAASRWAHPAEAMWPLLTGPWVREL